MILKNYKILLLIIGLTLWEASSSCGIQYRPRPQPPLPQSSQYVDFPSSSANNKNTSKIYVMRPNVGHRYKVLAINQDERLIGYLSGKGYLNWEVDPLKGDINIIGKIVDINNSEKSINISPEAGKTYYILQRINIGWLNLKNHFEFIQEEEAKELLVKLKKARRGRVF